MMFAQKIDIVWLLQNVQNIKTVICIIKIQILNNMLVLINVLMEMQFLLINVMMNVHIIYNQIVQDNVLVVVQSQTYLSIHKEIVMNVFHNVIQIYIIIKQKHAYKYVHNIIQLIIQLKYVLIIVILQNMKIQMKNSNVLIIVLK